MIQHLSRFIFLLSSVAALAFWLAENGYFGAECSTCNAAGTNSLIALTGVAAYFVAGLTSQKYHLNLAMVFFASHLLLVFAQLRVGAFCWFCSSILVLAVLHAAIWLWVRRGRARHIPASLGSGIVSATLLLFVGTLIYAEDTPDQVLETRTYHMTSGGKAESRPEKAVAEDIGSAQENSKTRQPILVKAYVRSTCGYCREFKNSTLPTLLDLEEVPSFTIQYITASPSKSVPYFEIEGEKPQLIKGLVSANRFAELLRASE